MKTTMTILLFLALVLFSCSENYSEQKDVVQTESDKDSAIKKEYDDYSALDEEKELFELIKKYNETGDTGNLNKVLDYWENGLNEKCLATFTPLYCGLLAELIGDKTKAFEYYRQSELLAFERIASPLDCMEYELDVKSEKELIQLFKTIDPNFETEEFKEKKITVQKYFLYVSQIALDQNKFSEVQDLELKEVDLGFLFLDFEIQKREDLFKMITGSEI